MPTRYARVDAAPVFMPFSLLRHVAAWHTRVSRYAMLYATNVTRLLSCAYADYAAALLSLLLAMLLDAAACCLSPLRYAAATLRDERLFRYTSRH